MSDDNDPYLNAAFIKSLHAQVVEMKGDVSSTAAATQQNTEAIKRIDANTQGIIEMFSALEGGFKVLSGIGRLAKPIFYIASACGAVMGMYAAWKAGFK
ncbi:hypothetical protein ACL598_17485 [Bordetella bronchialis]|uniref:hypothetical protein n=1 Tax=Bordetella bronchialis TaxID=463025 RepID=UPI003D006378